MAFSATQSAHHEQAGLDRDGIRGIVRDFIRILVQLSILLLAAGRVNWLNAWLYIGLFFVGQALFALTLAYINPQILNERGRFMRQNTKTFDKIFYGISIPLGLSMLVLAGLDARYGWSTMPLSMTFIGCLLFLPVIGFGLWAMAVNSYFSITVRIQEERGHQVCTTGPYKFVRHPGYVSFILSVASIPLILGSWWACLASGILIVLIIVRTALEDLTLHRELPGYRDYATATRYRLVPRLW